MTEAGQRTVRTIIRVIVICLLGGWTLMAWTADAVIGWSGWNADALGAWPEWVASLQPPAWLAIWVPSGLIDGARQTLIDWGPAIRASMQRVPDMTGWLGAVVWLIWLTGAGGLVLMGIAASAVVRLFRTGGPPQGH
jgi:hypothetical protein